MLRLGEFFSGFSFIGELAASAKRVEWSRVFPTPPPPPPSLQPSSHHPLLPSPRPPLFPPPVYFQILFFTSLTPLPLNFVQLMHICSPRSNVHHLPSDRVLGRDSNTKGKVFAVLDSSRAVAQSSSPFFQEQGRG